ncbi:MAG: hypothetical protein LBQ60_09860 [Bacteroidales bacterium]|jgi:hypothetical protein|nr:hypothetical protein [Bacteroidales bacterium]
MTTKNKETKKVNTLVMLLLGMTLSGCIKDAPDPCPVGDLSLLVFVENFQNPSDDPLFDTEPIFSTRINHLRYYLYRDGLLYEQGLVDSWPKASRAYYTFQYDSLEFGNYEIVLIGNCTKAALSGDPSNPASLSLTFPGCSDTEDFFTAAFPFTLDTYGLSQYEIGLSRAHGIVSYDFINVPNDITEIEVVMDNVGLQKWVKGDYQDVFCATHRYAFFSAGSNNKRSRSASDIRWGEDYRVATFPTVSGERSTYTMNLYRNGENTPYISQKVCDTLVVKRNQLLEITAIFNNGSFQFEIDMNTSWDGTSDAGGAEI